MKKILLILSLLSFVAVAVALTPNAQAQDTATFGTVVTSLSASAGGASTAGTSFATPGNPASLITWTVTFSSAPASDIILLQGSLDNSTYYTLDISINTAGEIRSVTTAAKFFRCFISAKSGGGTTTCSSVSKAQPSSSAGLFAGGTVTGDVTFANSSKIIFGSFGSIAGTSDGVATFKDNAGTSYGRINLGGTTASYPAIARNGTTANLAALLADGTGTYTGFLASNFILSTGVTIIPTANPTFNSGFGTGVTISLANGPLSFRVAVGTGGVATSGVVNSGTTAPNGWRCSVDNITAAAGHRADNTRQIASTTTTITVENQTTSTGAAIAWTASDVVNMSCTPF